MNTTGMFMVHNFIYNFERTLSERNDNISC